MTEQYPNPSKEHNGIDTPMLDRETIRKELQCRILPLNTLGTYKYTVICTTYEGKWILSRHKNRSTWETQGGHIENGETPLECAKRELFEESGIKDADIYPVCDYLGYNSKSSANGMVFLAVAHTLGKLPKSEIEEIKAFETLPAELTYPDTSPKLYAEAEKVLSSIEISAMAVVICDDEILTTNEIIFGKETLSLPKGHNEKHESLIETAIRECFEETDIVISKGDFERGLDSYSYEFLTSSNNLVRKVIVPFLFRVTEKGTPTAKEEKIVSVQWMNIEDFLQLGTHENVKAIVRGI